MSEKHPRSRRSAAVVAVAVGIAFVVGSAGGAYAGHKIHKKDIAKHAVGWNKLGTHLQARINKAGTPGPKGAKGDTGPAGDLGNILHNSHTMTVPAHSNGSDVEVTCATGANGDATQNGDAKGYVAMGGGFNVRSRDPGVYISQSRQLISLNGNYDYNGKGWLVTVNNTTASDQTVQAWVVCAYAPNDDSTD